jgi:hypothetical protein
MSDINTLRSALFETLAALKDKDKPMDLDRARAICDVSQTIINSAKVEVDFVKATGCNVDSGFINALPRKQKPGYNLVEPAQSQPSNGQKALPGKPLTGVI